MEQYFLKFSIMLVPGLFAITCHEVAHGYIAWRFGDPTAKMEGRLTLNPLKHIDIIGTLMLVIAKIGWAKPVPVVYENLRNPKRDMIWVAAVGPAVNIGLATLSALLFRVSMGLSRVHFDFPSYLLLEPITKMLAFSIYINLVLAIFNMIPLPPLDGGRVLVGLLPYRQAAALSRFEPYGMIVIILLVFFTPIFSYVLSPLLYIGVNLLAGPYSFFVFDVIRQL